MTTPPRAHSGAKGPPPCPRQDSPASALECRVSAAVMAMPRGPQSRTQDGDQEKPVPRRGRGTPGRARRPSLPCPWAGGVFQQDGGGSCVQTGAGRQGPDGIRQEGEDARPHWPLPGGWSTCSPAGEASASAPRVAIGLHASCPASSALQLYIFLMVQYLPKNCKIKRDPIAGEDNIIIRVNLIRHIIFRNLQVRLIKYLYQSLLDTQSSERTDASASHFRVCENVTGAPEAGVRVGLPV